MTNTYIVEYTDTFGGEANYGWCNRAIVVMPDLNHYGYPGVNYAKANKAFERELMRRAKALLGLTGVKGQRVSYGDTIEFRPHGSCTVMFITHKE